jgi:hypothetical protein
MITLHDINHFFSYRQGVHFKLYPKRQKCRGIDQVLQLGYVVVEDHKKSIIPINQAT